MAKNIYPPGADRIYIAISFKIFQPFVVVDYFGPSELLTMNDHESSIDHNASDSPESRLIGGAIQENKEKANNASPMTWVTKDDAPHLIVHGDRDMLVPFPQSKNYDARLDAAGVRSTLIHIEGGGHGQGFDTEKLTPLIVAFLGRNCSGKNARWKRRSSRHCHDAGSGSGIGDNSGGASRRPQPVGTFTSSATNACDPKRRGGFLMP